MQPHPTAPLLTLPPEIRRQIWGHALKSFTGVIYLRFNSSATSRGSFTIHTAHLPTTLTTFLSLKSGPKLSLLRVCRTIYADCSGSTLLWQQNSVALGFWPQSAEVMRLFPREIRHVTIPLDITNSRSCTVLSDTLVDLCEGGSELQSVTLRALVDWNSLSQVSVKNPDLLKRWFSELWWFALRLGKVNRTLVIDSKWSGDIDRQVWVGRLRENWSTIEELHKAWAGEVQIDGQLCDRDGEKLSLPFGVRREDLLGTDEEPSVEALGGIFEILDI